MRRLEDRATRFIAVVAASGSGKSSLVAAGLLPRLKDNAVEGSKDWLLPGVVAAVGERKQWTGLRITPGEMGDNPLLALAVKLAPLLPDESLTPGKVAERLASDPAVIGAYAKEALQKQPEWSELFLFVDQFEELFSIGAERYRAPFIELLAAAAQRPRMRSVVTVRADFYHRCLEWPKLAELLREATFPLAAPGVAALHEMITKPAARAGLDFEPGLSDRILDDTGTDPGALALLAFALHELYEAKSVRGQTHASRPTKRLAACKGAISKRAEDTFEKLSPAAQALLGAVFRALVDVNEFGVATRRRADACASRIVRPRRAIWSTHSSTRGSSSPIALPTGGRWSKWRTKRLLREWPRLTDWIATTATICAQCVRQKPRLPNGGAPPAT